MNRFVGEAPGRVNLIGEHTDYNGGYVLPTALTQRTRVEITLRDDDRVRVTSSDFDGAAEYELGAETASGGWHDYVQGVTKLLRQGGHVLQGFDVSITSDVPVGSGLSSSAALEVALLRGLRQGFGHQLDDIAIAKLGQRVENEFVGARVGIMDQMAASLAEPGSALFLDTRDLSFRRVRLPLEKCDLVVINSGVAHRNVGGDYNTRRSECEQACAALGVQSLRELTPKDLPRLDVLPDTLRRRAKHVITENARVLAAVPALELGDLEVLKHLFRESHLSMRDDYQVSIPEIDALVELAWVHPDGIAARLTGGGFGGSVVCLARKHRGEGFARQVAAEYSRKTGQKPTVLVPPIDL